MTDIVDIVSDCRGGGDGANFLGKMASKRGAAGGKFLRHEAGKHKTIEVFQTILVKELRRPPPGMDCDFAAVVTIIQRSVLPDGQDWRREGGLHFEMRVNDVGANPMHRKRRIEPAVDNPDVCADCRTYSAILPMRIDEEIINMLYANNSALERPSRAVAITRVCGRS